MRGASVSIASSPPVSSAASVVTASPAVALPPKTSFKSLLTGAGGDLHLELERMRERLLTARSFTPQELLAWQIRAGQFGLRVELISKVAEGIMGAARRLQNPQ